MAKSKKSSNSKIPEHLKRYLIQQKYSRYTPVEQATWRFIMRELTRFLYKNAHPSYKEGLRKTGISLDRIPSLENIDKCLKKFGWRAGCVSGFIPPQAFLELQAYRILPIATEIRRVENLDYTPAPDIVHEAAGHAPMLANKEYERYLRKYSEIASKAIITKKDFDQYKAIRELSDLKEQPTAKKEDIEKANKKVIDTSLAIEESTEAVMLSRMAWWATEYGLYGDINKPKIFGAGLLSSVGESQSCLNSNVRKIPFSLDVIKYSYDITDPQPQLFVTPSFQHLEKCLDQLSELLSYKKGGVFGLKRMQDAETVNAIQLDTGIQISGILETFEHSNNEGTEKVEFIRLKGPSQISYLNKEIKGHGKKRHLHGYSTPVGKIEGLKKPVSQLSKNDLKKLGWIKNKLVNIQYESGFAVFGKIKKLEFIKNQLVVMTLSNCTVKKHDKVYYQPEWGEFDLIFGQSVVSVFGGAADRAKYGPTDDFVNARLPDRVYTLEEKYLHSLYKKTETWLFKKMPKEAELQKVVDALDKTFANEWLLRFEILECAQKLKSKPAFYDDVRSQIIKSVSGKEFEKFVLNSLQLIEKKWSQKNALTA